MREATIKEKIQANPDLIPSLPDIVTKALQLVDKPGVSPDEFEGLLSQDPPLVATMLKIANSPVNGFAHEKESIRDAVIGIGLNGLRSILMGSTLKRFLGRQFTSYGKDPKTLWRHSMAVANAAKMMTRKLPDSPVNAEEMFVAGLLHDLGKLLLAPFLSRMGEDLSETAEPLHLAEERLLGISHQEAGGIIADKWNMKPLVKAVITKHHYKACAPDQRFAMAVVRLADQWATGNGMGAGKLESNPGLLAEDLEAIGLDAAAWEEMQVMLAELVLVEA
ncbi:MAG: HDOD domain-containing protein [Planctomycetota bacterium]|jgi:putative nucleotidyltransferase with HDIG domain